MSATAMRTPVPRERNTLDADRADPPVRPVAVNPRNGLPEPKRYGELTPDGHWVRSRPAAGEPLDDAPSCAACGGRACVTADRTVRIRHNRPCAVEDRLRARRDRSPAA